MIYAKGGSPNETPRLPPFALPNTEIDLSDEDMQRSAVRETYQADRVYAFQPAEGAIQRHRFQHRAD